MSHADEDAIREIENQFNVAWNRHDPDAIAASLADDAQFITVNGAWTTSSPRLPRPDAAPARPERPVPGERASLARGQSDVRHPRRRNPAHAVLDQGRGDARCTEPGGPRERRHSRAAQDRRPMAHRRDAEHRCPARPQALAASVRASSFRETGFQDQRRRHRNSLPNSISPLQRQSARTRPPPIGG